MITDFWIFLREARDFLRRQGMHQTIIQLSRELLLVNELKDLLGNKTPRQVQLGGRGQPLTRVYPPRRREILLDKHSYSL